MPRMARIVIPDIPHHIIQRGNRRQNVETSFHRVGGIRLMEGGA